MPTYNDFELYGPDSREAQQFAPPALLNTMGGGPSVWGNSYIDIVIVDDRETPDVYPSNGYYWSRIYFQNSDGNGLNFACENKNYQSGEPEYYESPYTEMTLPCTNYPNDYQTGPRLPWARMGLGYDSQSGDFSSQSISGGWSTNYYTGLWVPDSGSNGAIVIVYATEDLYINSNIIMSGDQSYAEYLDNEIGMKFGVYPTGSSTLHTPDSENISKYWYTKDYEASLIFNTSEGDIEISMDDILEGQLDYVYSNYNFITNSPVPETNIPFYAFFPRHTQTNKVRGIASIINSPEVPFSQAIQNAISYDMTEEFLPETRSTNQLTIQQIADYTWENIDGTIPAEDFYTNYIVRFTDEDGEYIEQEIDFSMYSGNPLDGGPGGGGPSSSDDDYNSNNYNTNLNPSDIRDTTSNNPQLTNIGIFNRTWFLTASQVGQLCDKLNTTDSSEFDAMLEGLQMWGNSPINAILDLRLYPFDVGYLNGNVSSAGDLILGRFDTHIYANYLNGIPICKLSLGEINVKPYYKNFLDYEPYTKLMVYIPYIGTMDLPTNLFMNCVIEIELVVDYSTGACTAIIYRKEPGRSGKRTAILYKNGTIGINMAVSGDNAAQYASDVVNAAASMIGRTANALMNPTENVAASLVGFAKDIADFSKTANEVNFEKTGSNSPTVNTYCYQKPLLITQRPKTALKIPQTPFESSDWSIYGDTMGWATAKTLAVSQLKPVGINYGTPINLDQLGHSTSFNNLPAPTQQELDEIKKLLNGGFYRGYNPNA